MNEIWALTIDDYLNVCQIAKKLGVKPGESMEQIFREYMKMKGQKPSGLTELNKEEIIKEYLSHGKNVLNIETNEDGKSNYKLHKFDNPMDNML